MKSVIIAALALGLGAASTSASAQDTPRQLGGAPTLPTQAPRPTTAAPRQLDATPTPVAAPATAPSTATVADSATRQQVVAAPPAVGPPPAPTPALGPPARAGYIMGGSSRPVRYQVGLKNGQVYNVYDVEVKSPLFGRSHLLLDGQQRIDLADVGFYEDQSGHYVRTTLPNSSRETTLRREKTGRISLYATYNTSYANSPYGGLGYGGLGYGGMGYGGFGGSPYGGYRTTKTEYFSKENGPIQNLNLRNLALATADNAGAQELLSNARRYRQSTIAAYLVGGGLLIAGLVESTRSNNNPGISPLFYAAIPVLIVPLIFQSKQAAAQRQAIAIYNSGRQ
ncbi:MAG: hypothetical protein ACRYG7_18140 [Janthinobacterium lividum]